MENSYAIIMAGGIGSRFWPVSRTSYPKQFIDLLGTGKTLIQSTYERFLKIVPSQNIYIVTNENYKNIVKEQLPTLNESQILGEPVMRNTAPCIAYASHKIYKINPEASIVVAPSDQLILDPESFISDINKALQTASRHSCLLTLGIKPSRPHTGYGYIQYTSQAIGNDFYKVKTFTEKPNLDLAKTFIQSGDFLWNAGIFIWSAKAIINALERYLGDINDIFKEGVEVFNTPKEYSFIQNAYFQCTNISIDYGILERAENVYVLPTDFGWSDLGNWESIYSSAEKDYVGNVVTPSDKVMMYDSSNCLVNVPKSKLVILQGLHDFIVVESNDTLVICPRDKENSVRQIVADVKSKFGSDYL